jgi:hypothetical protein
MRGTNWALRFLAAFIASFLLLTAFRMAGPLDTWHWRNPLPQGNSLRGLGCGNGFWVAVGENGTILTSPDTVAWTVRESGVGERLNAVAWGNGVFAAVFETSEGRAILTSEDGDVWTERVSSQ